MNETSELASDAFFAVPRTTVSTSAGDVELPILYYDNSHVIAVFAADPAGVAAKLEGTGLVPALHVGNRPVVLCAMYEYRLTSIGPYNEVGIGIAVYPEGHRSGPLPTRWLELLRPPDRRDQGAYVIDLPVTTEAARAAGSEIWGYPKFVAPIQFSLGGGRFSCGVEDPDDGSTIMEFSGRAIPTIPIPPSPLVLYSHNHGAMIRTHVDLRNGMRAHLPGGIKMKVGGSHHRMANNLRDIGLDGAVPLAVASTNRFQSRLNNGIAL
ncbi:acetoacetate decarboxylase family protein [Mycobacterium gastri]|uniref:acetoacetate decarboxylase family protein n=1 Tax=Mycobacterium gastri TaxID=1777 RepID=UPI00056AC53A|nr:acetoacetate decarboxylase family protein [Mycobacterium gastri]